MGKPITKLTPWLAAARVTGRVKAAAPPGTGRIPPAARDIYPLTARSTRLPLTAQSMPAGRDPALKATGNDGAKRGHDFSSLT